MNAGRRPAENPRSPREPRSAPVVPGFRKPDGSMPGSHLASRVIGLHESAERQDDGAPAVSRSAWTIHELMLAPCAAAAAATAATAWSRLVVRRSQHRRAGSPRRVPPNE